VRDNTSQTSETKQFENESHHRLHQSWGSQLSSPCCSGRTNTSQDIRNKLSSEIGDAVGRKKGAKMSQKVGEKSVRNVEQNVRIYTHNLGPCTGPRTHLLFQTHPRGASEGCNRRRLARSCPRYERKGEIENASSKRQSSST
jgi:hypothetical protein